jgi:hypothetical protein
MQLVPTNQLIYILEEMEMADKSFVLDTLEFKTGS